MPLCEGGNACGVLWVAGCWVGIWELSWWTTQFTISCSWERRSSLIVSTLIEPLVEAGDVDLLYDSLG